MPDIDFGHLSEALNDKSDRDLRNVDTTAKADAVIDYQEPTSANNYTWYRKYASGWVEQGASPTYSSWALQTVTFSIPFRDGRYSIVFGGLSTRSSGTDVKGMVCEQKYSTGFKYYAGGSDWVQKDWVAKGYAAN